MKSRCSLLRQIGAWAPKPSSSGHQGKQPNYRGAKPSQALASNRAQPHTQSTARAIKRQVNASPKWAKNSFKAATHLLSQRHLQSQTQATSSRGATLSPRCSTTTRSFHKFQAHERLSWQAQSKAAERARTASKERRQRALMKDWAKLSTRSCIRRLPQRLVQGEKK